jgi:membrane associated rhomboid family serine protease
MVHVYTVPQKKSFFSGISITLILVLINVVAFILFFILTKINPNFIDFIAIKPGSILQGKYLWTFLTSMFMHANFLHIFANMFSLFFIGSLVERILGRRRYFWFYLFSGLFAGLLFVLSALVFVNEINFYAVGASGAIFGLLGLLMIVTPNLPVYLMFIPIPVKMKYAAPGMLIILWFISIAGNLSVGNTAHLGGFVIGVIYGIYLRQKYKKKTSYISRMFS